MVMETADLRDSYNRYELGWLPVRKARSLKLGRAPATQRIRAVMVYRQLYASPADARNLCKIAHAAAGWIGS